MQSERMSALQLTMSLSRKLRRRWFSVVFSLLGIGGLVYYVSRYSPELERLYTLSAPGLGLLLLLVILGHLFSAMKFQVSASAFGVKLPLQEAFMMVESGSLINTIPFSAMGFRALYLKKVHGLKYVDFGLGILATLVTGFTSAGLLGSIGALRLVFDASSSTLYLLLGLFATYVVVPPLLVGTVYWLKRQEWLIPQSSQRSQDSPWWRTICHSLFDGADAILLEHSFLVRFLGLNLITNLVLATRLWLISELLGYPFSFWSSLVLQSVGQFSAIVTVLPAGTIGLREALIGLGAKGISGQAVSGVMISTVDRLTTTACIVLLGSISTFILHRRIARAERVPLSSE